MNFIKKIFNVKEKKESKISGMHITGSSPVMWPDRDYENFSKETYLKNATAYKAIFEISKAVSSVPWKLYEKGNDGKIEEIKEHPMIDLIKRPNPDNGWAFLMFSLAAYNLLAGNAYLERVSPETGPNKDFPKELYVQRPDRISILNKDGQIIGYQYSVDGNIGKWEIDPITKQADLLHLKLFHPLDDFYGAAPTESGAREIDTSNEATNWNKKLLENEGRPGMAVTFEGMLSDKQYERIKQQMNEEFSGNNVGKTLILDGEKTSIQPYGWSPTDMDFSEGDRALARKIANIYGVPSMLLGIPGDNTYSNYAEARLAFWEETILFYLNYYKTEFNNWFFGKDSNLFLDYDLNKIPALQPKRDAYWEKITNATFLSLNEKREALGYAVIKGGEEILVPATLVPLSFLSEPNISEDNEKQTEDEKQAIQKLINEGFSKEEAEQMLGIYKSKMKRGKSEKNSRTSKKNK